MSIRISRPIDQPPSLTEFFSPQVPVQLAAKDIAEELSLVYPYPNPYSALRHRFEFSQVLGALAATNVNGTTVGNFFRWVHAADVICNDAASRSLELVLEHAVNGTRASVAVLQLLATNQRLGLPRPILIPQGHRLVGLASAVAAGFRLTLNTYFIDFNWAEFPPHL